MTSLAELTDSILGQLVLLGQDGDQGMEGRAGDEVGDETSQHYETDSVSVRGDQRQHLTPLNY